VRTRVTTYPLDAADAALDAVRTGAIEGAAVLVTGE
jgi:D-arabinose 1-dehydrogenase-like Zn-dependent alcohol dehydrogenase